VGAAADRALDVHADRNGNLWAWWGDADADGPGVVTGSHVDSVPDGGAYDGPLGVVSAFLAVDMLRASGFEPARPIGIAAFADEEGARFGIACAGSRLLVGGLDPDRARGLVDNDGVRLAEAMQRTGHDPAHLGRDDETLRRIGVFVELHVEQGRGLIDLDTPLAVADGIWPHGRWRFDFEGAANHAGTTAMADRQDPMLTYAVSALSASKQARLAGARATFGRVHVEPNGTNAIPSHVTAWLDARAAESEDLERLVDSISQQAYDRAARDGTALAIRAESLSPLVSFDVDLRDRLARVVGASYGSAAPAPALPTAAGHDAGILAAAGVPAAMLFVRNPTGVSHSPAEFAEEADCLAGVGALARVIEALA
jgi:N-carbamoyl-L-amino-acid hydrolase